MESVESVLDDDKIEEVFGGAGHSKATRASRVTAAKLQKAQLEEATAQVEELRRQVSTLTDAGEDSYSSALAFSPARTCGNLNPGLGSHTPTSGLAVVTRNIAAWGVRGDAE